MRRVAPSNVSERSDIFCFGSAGGHLRELTSLIEQLGLPHDRVVVGSSRGDQLSALSNAGWRTVEIPLVEPRSPLALLRAYWPALRILRALRPRVILTTGSAVAFAFAPLAAILGTRFIFVESLTRVDRPSQTGRLVELLPHMTLRTQTKTWPRRRGPLRPLWTKSSSVLDLYRCERLPEAPPPPTRIFVAVGIMTRRYSFGRLFEAVRAAAPSSAEIRIQSGEGDVPVAGATFLGRLTSSELRAEINAADVVVIHAGVGLTLDCFDAGKFPVVIARRQAFGEHVDDHQTEFASVLKSSGLARVETIETLDWNALVAAAGARIVKLETSISIDRPALLDDIDL
jgi:UDP-N-acetylglucosamine--N-acetylmuramyl-(pentapeptide) pyrophosphoryl-undecaprenol N-acetylglucosamine transferase